MNTFIFLRRVVTNRALQTFVGATVVYAVMAACAASSDPVHGGAGNQGGVTDPVPAAKASSGKRLKVRALVADDGAREAVGWYDSERKEECSFRIAEDGAMRCQPVNVSNGTEYYKDSSCNTPVLLFEAPSGGCSDMPAYVQTQADGSGQCGVRLRLHKIGPKVTGTIYEHVGTFCEEVTSTADLYTTTPVAPSSFVKAAAQTEP